MRAWFHGSKDSADFGFNVAVGEKREFAIYTEFITLGQLVKALGLIGMGGEIREFLYQNEVRINGELDKRRGRKIRVGDVVAMQDLEVTIIAKQ